MRYDFKTQEDLKRLIYTGNVTAFKEKFEAIRQEDPTLAAEYINGTKDEGRGLLSWAAMQVSCNELISYLVDTAGADANHQDGKGRTALLLAIEYGCLDNAKTLLIKKADLDIADLMGNTPLHVAAQGNNNTTAMIELLCASGAKLNKNAQGATPFHTAAKYSLEAMHALIKYKRAEVDIDQQDYNGDTPLHYAATSETNGINATYLLLLGANRTICNEEGQTPAQTAQGWDPDGKDWQSIIEFTPKIGWDPESFYATSIEAQKKELYGEDDYALLGAGSSNT